MSADKGLLLHSLLSMIARFTGVGLNFALHILIARMLTLGNYGDVKMLLTLITGTALMSRIGIEQLIVKEIASVEQNQQTFGTQFLSKSYQVVFFTSFVFIALWLLFSPWIADSLFGNISHQNMMLASIGILFFNLVTINAFYFKSLRMASSSALVQNAIPAISFLVLIGIFWSSFQQNQNYLNLYTASNVLAGILSVLVIIPWLKRKRPLQTNIPRFTQVIKRSLPLAPVSLFPFFMLYSDTIMVGALLDSEQVGLYSTAAQISFISLFFLGALDATIYPRLLNISKNHPEKLRAFFWKATALVILGLLLVTLMMAAFAKPSLGLFGEIFKQATFALLILLAAQWLRATSLTFSFMFIIENQVKRLNIVMVASLIINLIANYFLIQRYGMEGAATATLIANGFLAGSVVLLFFHHKLLVKYKHHD